MVVLHTSMGDIKLELDQEERAGQRRQLPAIRA